MDRDQFERFFKDTGVPLLNRFHQAGTDALANRAVFLLAAALAVVGLVTLIRWVL
jgi:hypothetical protein